MTTPQHRTEADDPPGSASDVYEFIAKHVGPAFGDLLRTCHGVVAEPAGPHHLAHFSGSVLDFSLDSLDSVAHVTPSDHRVARERTVRLSQQLSILFGGLDDTLRDVHSGALIRLVVHATSGASYCDQIVPGQLVVGTRLGAEEHGPTPLPMIADVRTADMIMAGLATAVRRSLRQGSEDPGGFEQRSTDEDDAAGGVAWEPWVENVADDEQARAFVAAGRRAMAMPGLHYVALCRDTEILAAVDQLDRPELGKYFTQISVGARRAFYADFGRGLGFLAGRLARMSQPIIGGPLRRVVLDVQQGALYYYRLRTGTYLLGVTLDQSRVDEVDRHIAELVSSCMTPDDDA